MPSAAASVTRVTALRRRALADGVAGRRPRGAASLERRARRPSCTRRCARGGTERRITTLAAEGVLRTTRGRSRATSPSRAASTTFTLHGRLVEPPRLRPVAEVSGDPRPVYTNTVRNEWRGHEPDAAAVPGARGRRTSTCRWTCAAASGYGVEFRETFQGDWGGGDLEDLHSAVEYLKTLPYVDGDRIGIWGSSYGGMMTLFALFKKPGLFKAGVAGAPAMDVITLHDRRSAPVAAAEHASRDLPQVDRCSTIGEELQDHLLLHPRHAGRHRAVQDHRACWRRS